MGGNYSAQPAEPMSQVLSAYEQFLPGVINSTTSQDPSTALNQLNATLGTQPLYNALNLQQLQNYAVPTAQVGQQVQNSNALAGSATNLAQLNGPGADVANSALALARQTNPDYYKVQDATSNQAANLVNSISTTGLSPGEAAATERANNIGKSGTGNLGLNNNTNTIADAINFGGAFNNKLGVLGSALGSASGVANTAQNTGFSPINLALGQPNASTQTNFGTGTFAPTNASTQNQSANLSSSFGSNLLGGMNSFNTSSNTGAYGLANANALPNYIPNISC